MTELEYEEIKQKFIVSATKNRQESINNYKLANKHMDITIKLLNIVERNLLLENFLDDIMNCNNDYASCYGAIEAVKRDVLREKGIEVLKRIYYCDNKDDISYNLMRNSIKWFFKGVVPDLKIDLN